MIWDGSNVWFIFLQYYNGILFGWHPALIRWHPIFLHWHPGGRPNQKVHRGDQSSRSYCTAHVNFQVQYGYNLATYVERLYTRTFKCQPVDLGTSQAEKKVFSFPLEYWNPTWFSLCIQKRKKQKLESVHRKWTVIVAVHTNIRNKVALQYGYSVQYYQPPLTRRFLVRPSRQTPYHNPGKLHD